LVDTLPVSPEAMMTGIDGIGDNLPKVRDCRSDGHYCTVVEWIRFQTIRFPGDPERIILHILPG
jgi:hypothetical protein